VRQWHLIGGGEPLYHPDKVLPIMELIKEYRMYGYLNTNGTLFTSQMIEKLVRIKWDYIKFSLHAASPAEHDYLTNNPGAFTRCVNALKQFRYWKNKLHTDKPCIEIGPVLNSMNFNKLEDLISLAKKLGAQEFRPQSLIVHTPKGARLKLRAEHRHELLRQIEKVKAFADAHGICTNIEDFRDFDIIEKSNEMTEVIRAYSHAYSYDKGNQCSRTFLYNLCLEPWYHLTIHANGKAGVCGFTDIHECDDIHGKTLKEVWFGEALNRIRAQISAGQLPEYCNKCVSVLVLYNKNLREELLKLANTHPVGASYT
jgi:MoaA/NifB/PqqE/SkfB family radical SAM enzyme